MITEERLRKLPDWIKKTTRFLTKTKVPAKIGFIVISLLATMWFLFRVIPKPSRALYPCMQVAAPIMSSFVIWILTFGFLLDGPPKKPKSTREVRDFPFSSD